MGDSKPYHTLKYAINNVGHTVNLFAIVIEIGVARQSRGTDKVLTLKIVDPSYQETFGISICFFARILENMPQVRSSGDIICLHRVKIDIHDEHPYVLYKKRLSSFALFEGGNASSLVPYQTSTKFNGFQDEEIFNQIKIIRTWLLSYHLNSDADTLQLNEIIVDKVFDLVCKVLYVREISDGAWLMFVWDGTDTPPVDLETDLDSELANSCPLHVEEFSLSRDILQMFPCDGTVLRIVAMNFVEGIPLLHDGVHWVKFCNITSHLHFGIWKGMLQPNSKIRLLADENHVVLRRERLYRERIQSRFLPMLGYPQPSHLTVTDDEMVNNATLMDSLVNPEAVHKLKCVVRVVSSCPWKGDDLISPINGRYRIRFALEDPTARIHCYILGEEGVKFFGGRNPPTSTLTQKMNSLLGISETIQSDDNMCDAAIIRNPPWISVCLKSLYLDRVGRSYEIYATRFVG